MKLCELLPLCSDNRIVLRCEKDGEVIGAVEGAAYDLAEALHPEWLEETVLALSASAPEVMEIWIGKENAEE